MAVRDTARAFADDAGYIAEKLSDRIRNFFTINEFHTFVDMGIVESRSPSAEERSASKSPPA